MLKRLFLLLLLPIGLVQAQRTVIAGKFPYQRDVPYSVQFLSNQITFVDEWGKVSDTSDTQGFFHLELTLKEPSILRFYKQESLELYLRPGDSLWIEMINGRNIKYEGTAARENRLMHYFNVPNFIPTEIEEDPAVYSHFIDSLADQQIMALTSYETDEPDQDFVSLFVAEYKAVFLDRKISLYKKLDREGLEGTLMEWIRQQLQEPLIDEVRSSSYTYTLRELFQLEVGQIIGQEIPPFIPFSRPQYPPGFEELYARHWRERLAKKPKLYRYFELEESADKIRDCSKPEQLPLATKAWAQIQKASEFPGFVEMMAETYQKKVIQYQLRKLPELAWKDEQSRDFKLLPDEKNTLIVFWDALTSEGLEAFQQFQERPSMTFARQSLPDSVLAFAQYKRMIWVQVGGDVEKWRQTIAGLPNHFVVQHCRVDAPRDIQALKPYFYKSKFPIAFTLQSDLIISSITDQPTALEAFRQVDSRGRIIWRPGRP